MRKIILTIIGASVMLLSIGQIASAGDNQNTRHVTRQSKIYTDAKARDANAEYRGGAAQSVYGGGAADASLVAPAGR